MSTYKLVDYLGVKMIEVNDVAQSCFPPLKTEGYWTHMIPSTRPERVLMLGVGGGSIARLLLEKYPGIKIVGVDNDPSIIQAAKDHMKLDEIPMELHIEDAYAFIEKETRTFDLIIVDLFFGSNFDFKILIPKYIDLLKKRLNKGGRLSINTPGIDYGITLQLPTRTARDLGANIVYNYV